MNKNNKFIVCLSMVLLLIVKPIVLKGSSYDYDCVRIIAFDSHFFTAANIGRIDFIKSVHNSSLPHKDTLLYDSKEINRLCMLLDKLEKQCDLPTSSNQTVSKLVIPNPSDRALLLLQIETTTLDNRVLLVFIKQRSQKLVWMSENLVDMESSRYLMSQDLKKYMRKFLPVLFE